MVLNLLLILTLISNAHDYVIRGYAETDDSGFAITVRDYARVKKDLAILKDFKYAEYSRYIDISSTTMHWGIKFNLYFSEVDKSHRDAFESKADDWVNDSRIKKLRIEVFASDNNISGLCQPDTLRRCIVK